MAESKKTITTFPSISEFEKARRVLDEEGVEYEVISPEPAYARVGAPAIEMDAASRRIIGEREREFICSGWMDKFDFGWKAPQTPPPEFDDDIFGRAAVVVLARCIADERKLRIVARLSGDLTEVFPYMNTEMETASYNADGVSLSFMDGYRMITLYARRIAVAKADDIVDAWRVLEDIRLRVNEIWARRGEIEPSYEMRRKPPVLEILKRLPLLVKCGECGELTCTAFACKVHAGLARITECRPVFEGDEYEQMREPLLEMCRLLGQD